VLTAVISDLHLGGDGSVLGVPAVRDRLLAELQDVDQLVLLGDVLALRVGPVLEVTARAETSLKAIGEAMAGRRIVIVPGNHDHALTASLGSTNKVETTLEITPDLDEPLRALATWMPDCELVLSYPGVWLRPDVYATHGHYLDCHAAVPRLEALSVAAIQSMVVALPPVPEVADYEAVLAPLYAFHDARARTRRQGSRPTAGPSVRDRILGGATKYLVAGDGIGSLRTRAAPLLAAAVVAGLSWSGVGRFNARMSPAAIRLGGFTAMGQVVDRLGIDARHVIFGHTHGAGPLPGEPPWTLPGGARLTNSGSWVFAPALITHGGAGDPYWPGTCVLVSETGDPELRPLLAELATPVAT
jgi:hypothetical protein